MDGDGASVPRTALEALFCQTVANGGLNALLAKGGGASGGAGEEDATAVDALRVPIWRRVLGIPRDLDEEALSEEISKVEMDLPNQRVIRVDAERTRGDQPAFADLKMQARIQRLLTYYCKKGYACKWPTKGRKEVAAAGKIEPVSYKQGLNEILAVFLSLGPSIGSLSDGLIMALLGRFISYYAPRVYASSDDEMTGLQCSLRLLRLLLQYHQPSISQLLDQYNCEPELYSTPWILCLMARGNSIRQTVLPIWDFLVCCCSGKGKHPGPVIFHCVLLSFLSSLHPRLVETANDPATRDSLPMVLARATLFGKEHVQQICSTALDYYCETPLSFRKLIAALVYAAEEDTGNAASTSLAISSALLARLDQRLVVKISIPELLLGAGSRFYTSARPSAAAGGQKEQRQRQNHRQQQQQRQQVDHRRQGGGPKEPVGFDRLLVPRTNAAGVGAGTASAPSSPSSSSSASSLPGSSSATSLSSGVSVIPPSPVAIERVAPRYFLVDVRPKDEFEAGHMPTAFHLDPALLEEPEELKAVMEGFSGLKGVHFAIMGSGNERTWYHTPALTDEMLREKAEAERMRAKERKEASTSPSSPRDATEAKAEDDEEDDNDEEDDDDDDGIAFINPLSSHEEEDDYAGNEEGRQDFTRTFILLFLQRGFLRVSEVEGGYASLHQHQANFLSTVLVQHDPEQCRVCTGGLGSGGGKKRRRLTPGVSPSPSPPATATATAAAASTTTAAAAAAGSLQNKRRGDYSAVSSSSFKSGGDDEDEEEEEVEVTLFEQESEKPKAAAATALAKPKPSKNAPVVAPSSSTYAAPASASAAASNKPRGSSSSSSSASASFIVPPRRLVRLCPLHRSDLVDEEVGLVGLDSFTQQQRQRQSSSGSSSSGGKHKRSSSSVSGAAGGTSGNVLTSSTYDPDYQAYFARLNEELYGADGGDSFFLQDDYYYGYDGSGSGSGGGGARGEMLGVPVLKEWVYLEQETDELERAANKNKGKPQHVGGSGGTGGGEMMTSVVFGLRVAKNISGRGMGRSGNHKVAGAAPGKPPRPSPSPFASPSAPPSAGKGLAQAEKRAEARLKSGLKV